jgi:hypothetical protein
VEPPVEEEPPVAEEPAAEDPVAEEAVAREPMAKEPEVSPGTELEPATEASLRPDTDAVLSATLESLGQAHHRPFSRA